MLIPPHIRTRVSHTRPVHEKRGSHQEDLSRWIDSHISDEVPGARPRIFSVTMTAFQPCYPSPQPHEVVINEHQFFFGIPFWKICGRDDISGICGEKGQPLI